MQVERTHTFSVSLSLSVVSLFPQASLDNCATKSSASGAWRVVSHYRTPRNRARRIQVEPRSRTAGMWLVEEVRVQQVKLSSAKALYTHALHGMLLCTRCFQTFTTLALFTECLRHCQRVLWTQGSVHTRTSWNASLYSVLSDFHRHLPLFTECLRHCQRVLWTQGFVHTHTSWNVLCTQCFHTFTHTCLSLLNALRHCQRVLWLKALSTSYSSHPGRSLARTHFMEYFSVLNAFRLFTHTCLALLNDLRHCQ
jgi:hypothetical protein